MKTIKLLAGSALSAAVLVGCEQPVDSNEYLRSVSDNLKSSTNSADNAIKGASAVEASELEFIARNMDNEESYTMSLARKLMTRDGMADHEGAIEMINSVIEQFVEHAEDYGTVTEQGGNFLWEPDTSILCDPESTPEEDINLCVDIVSKISVLFEPAGDNVGSIALSFNNSRVAIVDYAPTSAAYTLVLDGVKSFVETAVPEEDFPDTFSGRAKFEIETLSDTEGRLTWSIPAAIAIGDAEEDFMLSVAATDALFQLTGDETAGTGEVSIDVAGITAQFPVETIDGFGVDGKGLISVPAFTATMIGNSNSTEDEADDSMQIDAELNAAGILFSINGNAAATVEGFTLDADMVKGQMTYNQDFDFDVAVTDQNLTDYLEETLAVSVSIPENTVLAETDDCNGEEGTDVVSGGPVAMSFAYDGLEEVAISGSFPAGTCFAD
jgi:hypothetical protein